MVTVTVGPTSSFQFDLPDDYVADCDPSVSSFWRQDDPLLLQISSHMWIGVDQAERVDARSRLLQRMSKSARPWTELKVDLRPSPLVDAAMGHQVDDEGDSWLHVYFVWPHLTIYATLIAPQGFDWGPDNWAYAALRSIRLKIH